MLLLVDGQLRGYPLGRKTRYLEKFRASVFLVLVAIVMADDLARETALDLIRAGGERRSWQLQPTDRL